MAFCFIYCVSTMSAQAMKAAFEKELMKFDMERVLPAWDGLITRQQAALESLGVPAMFPTDTVTDREARFPAIFSTSASRANILL